MKQNQKVTLKDFPCPIPGYEEYARLQEWIEKVCKWKSAFEKQLQKKLEELEKRQELCDAEVYEFTKEILGVGKKTT